MKRFFSKFTQYNKFQNSRLLYFASLTGVGGFTYALYKHNYNNYAQKIIIPVYAISSDEKAEIAPRKIKSREERFLEFSSFECNGVVYMTPADFLESVTQRNPRYRINRQTISVKDAKRMVKSTPTKRNGSKDLFRSIDKDGLISYTEYLFLLGVLTKPHSGFKIAFNMFDTDMNEEVDKAEFLVMERTMQHLNAEVSESLKAVMETKRDEKSWFLFKLINRAIIAFTNPSETLKTESEELLDNDMNATTSDENESTFKFPAVTELEFDTTMLIHFFGKSGQDKLRFIDFSRFMENLQTEVLEIEFLEFSKGLKTISESEFAKILLRYTTVDDKKHDIYCKRVLQKMSNEKGITFDDFKAFFQFLNSIEDFILAMKMYTLVDRPISQQEFHQAVKACTQTTLSTQLVATIFYMFDEDNDGFLSYNEFIKTMKNRMGRGFNLVILFNNRFLFLPLVGQGILFVTNTIFIFNINIQITLYLNTFQNHCSYGT